MAHAANGGVLLPLPRGATDGTWLRELFQGGDLQTVAPGMPGGLQLSAIPRAPVKEVEARTRGKETPPDLQPVVDAAEVTKVQVGCNRIIGLWS